MHKSAVYKVTKRIKSIPVASLVSAVLAGVPGFAASPGGSKSADNAIYSMTVKDIHGKDVKLSDYRGRVVMIVNTASGCGFTPQMANLVALKNKYGPQGFEVLAFPSNDFKQEKGSAEEIEKFATETYKINFPLMAESSVGSSNPLFQVLTTKTGGFPQGVIWNFEKFLVNKKGEPVARYRSRTTPDAPEVTAKLETLLAEKAATPAASVSK